MAKGSGMIHPNMATMLGVCFLHDLLFLVSKECIFALKVQFGYIIQVITTDALVTSKVWRKMVQVAVSRSFNQITVRVIDFRGLAVSVRRPP